MAKNKTQFNKDILERIKKAEGQIKAVRKMYEEGESDKLEITQQITAARSALSKVSAKLLQEELQSCYSESDQDKIRKVLENIAKLN
ncbi:MAG: metal-sensitive transcriptional regulator [Candidatus Paceibacterota bacterium]